MEQPLYTSKEQTMKTVLYIHGFNGKAKGGTYDGLVSFFKDKPDYRVISFPFPELHTDVEKTQQQIERYIDENDISILVGASLGGFYTLTCRRPVFKVAINPCMLPSREIPLLKDRDTGAPVHVGPDVLAMWKKAEEYDLPADCKQAAGIFGKQDETFHYDENHNYKPFFEQLFGNNAVLVEGVHSLTIEQIAEGMNGILSL